MDPRLLFLLLYYGTFASMSPFYQRQARSFGYVEHNMSGRAYTRGQRTPVDALKQAERNMILLGHNVRVNGWTTSARHAIRRQGFQPGTYTKYLNDAYSDYRGKKQLLPDTAIVWLRVWSCEHPPATVGDVRAAILMYQGVVLSRSSVKDYLKRAGITRQRLRRIAAQRFTPANLQYALEFQQRVRGYAHPCWFDESGISQSGMAGRHNVGMGIRGSGGAYIRDTLRYPRENLSVLGLIDKHGVFGVESFEGGTDTIRVDEYVQRKVALMAARGVDVIILDNCPAHRAASIAFWCGFYNITVDFLPRYWPQWNPIEVRAWCVVVLVFFSPSSLLFFIVFFLILPLSSFFLSFFLLFFSLSLSLSFFLSFSPFFLSLQLAWNDMKNHLKEADLRTSPGKAIEDALYRIPASSCNNWIRHCGVYVQGTHYI